MGHPLKPAYADVELIEEIAARIESGVFISNAFGERGFHPSIWPKWCARADAAIAEAVDGDAVDFVPVFERGTLPWAVTRLARARWKSGGDAQAALFESADRMSSGRDLKFLAIWAKLAFPESMGDKQTITLESKDPGKVAGSLLAELKGTG